MIDIDVTLFIQLANFIITLIVLNYLLIRPIRDIIKKRNETVNNLSQEAQEFSASAREKLDGYEEALTEARREAAVQRDEMKLAGVAEEKAILGAAHEEATAYLNEARSATEAEATSAFDVLKAEVKPLAEEAAAKIIA